MKILMLHTQKTGGVAIHVSEILNELRKRNFSVDEITRDDDLKIDSFAQSYFKLKKLGKKWSKDYDLIHAHDWSIVYPLLRGGVKNVVATFHALPTNPLARIFQDYCIKKLGKNAIVISPKMHRRYTSATLINNGVNLTFFKKLRGHRDATLVGMAQQYNKNHIVKTVATTGLHWIFTDGALPFDKIPEFYAKIGTFVSIPYKEAGFNMVWLEAMACEVPYIIGTTAGIGEVLPIYKVKDFVELNNILVKIKNKELEPLKNLRKWITKNGFVWPKNAKKLIELYERAIE